MTIGRIRAIAATLVVSSTALFAVPVPAKADTTSTLLITAAAAVALMTGINVAEKSAKAHQVVGYLQNGSIVYADGHVVAPNGMSWYPGNVGENISCNAGRCYIVGPGGYPGGYPGAYGYNGGGYPGGYGYNGSGYPGGYASAPGYGGGTYYPPPPVQTRGRARDRDRDRDRDKNPIRGVPGPIRMNGQPPK